MSSARSDGARKSMRAIPLTQRQRKHGKPEGKASQHARRKQGKPVVKVAQRAQSKPEVKLDSKATQPNPRKQGKPEVKAAQPQRVRAASPQRESARGPRGGRPAHISPAPVAIPSAGPSAAPGVRPSAPLDLNAESDASRAPAPLIALAKKALSLVTRSAPPRAETHSMVMTPTPETGAPLAAEVADAPHRVKVRVRRKRPAAAPLEAAPERDMHLAETSLLPDARVAPPSAASQALFLSDTTLLSADAAGVSPAMAKEEPAGAIDTPSADGAPGSEAVAETETVAGITAAERGAPGPTRAEPAEAAPPEPRKPATTRKLPTLAVMAALATRAEARAESGALPELDMVAPVAPRAVGAPIADEPPASSEREVISDPAPCASGRTEAATRAPEKPEKPATTPSLEPGGASVTRPRGSLDASASQPAELADSASIAPEAPSGSGRRRMWWLSQPQEAGASGDGLDGHDERDGLNGRNGRNGHAGQDESERHAEPASGRAPHPTRPLEATRAPLAPPIAPVTSVTQPRPRPLAPPIALPPAPRISPSIPRQPDYWREAARGISRPRRAGPSDVRARAQEQERDAHAPLLVWTGGAQAALCGVAALVAALALLNGTAGERARIVFAWAMAFALIAGAGAGLGHLAWQMKRARLAPLALVFSQLGLLAWSLALLGARPSLMALAPFTAALALRGLGRWAASVAAVAALALYGAALALNLTGAWAPMATFEPVPAAALDVTILAVGMALTAIGMTRLYAVGERERARTRAVERAARLAALELDSLRSQTEDDADALRRALSAALRGVPTEDVWADGALSPLADQVSVVAQRLVELAHDRKERKRLESATRRLIRNIERAWLGLSWSWPEASGVILDDLVALLRTPPSEPSQAPETLIPTGQLVAPHLYRAWQPGDSIPSQPLSLQPLSPQASLWPDRPSPSQPSGVWPTLWPSDPEPGPNGADPLALPPSPRWRGPDDEPRPPDSAMPWPSGPNGSWPSSPSRPGW